MKERKSFKELTKAQQRLVELNINTNFGSDITYGYGDNATYLVPLLDEALELIGKIQHERNLKTQIEVGDYVLENGKYKEVASVWKKDNEIQLTGCDSCEHHSYIGPKGNSSYSGTIDYPIKADFVLSEEKKSGLAWSFLFGSGANMGVYFDIEYKVWKKGE